MGTRQWNALIRVARAEMLMATLGERAAGTDVPDKARLLLDEARAAARRNHDAARFEVLRMADALRDSGIPVVLMKGSAYLMALLPPLPGRNIGDLDIMVPRESLADTERALKGAGWLSVKPRGTYDDAYYRQWMHELPPLAHEMRGGVIDLHHTILPLTARLTPRPERIFEHAVRPAALAPGGETDALPDNIFVMSPPEMLLHSATHLAYDGDFQGGARNLWDIDRLVRHFAKAEGFWDELTIAAAAHDLTVPLARALRLAEALYETPSPPSVRGRGDIVDRLALRKLRGHDEYGQGAAPGAQFLLFLRGHWLRMPPLMLARHLWTKWRARRGEGRREAPQNAR
nr:nucleotidyltransferase family protein [Pacificimonas pallii]